MNFINKLALFILALLTFEINSQDTNQVNSAELMNSYNESVNKLAESYINIIFLTVGDTLPKTTNNGKFTIPNKENQIQGLVQEINKQLPVKSIVSNENLVSSLENVSTLLSSTLQRNPDRMSGLMKETFLLSSDFIIKSVTNRSVVSNSDQNAGILSRFWSEVILITLILLSFCLTGFLIYFRYESKKHIKNVTTLILATSIEQEK